MLHLRTTADAAPSGAASRRALTAVRLAADEAPALDGAPEVILVLTEALAACWVQIERLLEAASLISARGPPGEC